MVFVLLLELSAAKIAGNHAFAKFEIKKLSTDSSGQTFFTVHDLTETELK